MAATHSNIWIALVAICLAAAHDQYVVVNEGPQDRAVLSGQSAELTCHIHHAKSKPNHIVQWVANSARTGLGKPVSYNGKITARDLLNKFSISTTLPYNLLIHNVDIDDAGKYTCNNVRNGKPIGGIDPQLIALDPEFCPMLGISTFKENDIITYTWSVKYAGDKNDSQKPIIKWALNGIQQTATKDETTKGVFKSTITMAAASVDDEKELTCSFSVLNIQELCSTRLDIQYPAREPTLLIGEEEINTDHEVFYLTEGNGVILRGVSEGNPKPLYTWQFKGMSEASFSHVEHGDTKQVKGLRSKETGVYKCCARNSLNSHRKCSEITIDIKRLDTERLVGTSKAERTSSKAAMVSILAIIQILYWVLKKNWIQWDNRTEKAEALRNTCRWKSIEVTTERTSQTLTVDHNGLCV